MGLIDVDFSEVIEAIPAGVYKARITGADYKVAATKDGGQWPHVAWEFETYGADTPAHNGRKVRATTSTTGKGAFRLQQVVYAATGETLGKSNTKLNTEQMLGKELMITVQYKEGNQYPEVAQFKAITQ